MPNLVYSIPAYTPFTKILSASANQDKTDIQNRINWSGNANDITTGLDGTNIQGVTAITGVNASLTTQGVTLTAKPGQGVNGNNITIAFTSGATAGSEVVTVTGQAVSVQVQSGVSTVTQVVTAINLSSSPGSYYVTASGSSASTVATAAALNLAGGITSGGLSRTTKLQPDVANWVVINSSTGTFSSEPQLALSRGGTGLLITPANQNPGDVIQINPTKTGFVVSAPTSVPASLKLFQYQNLA